MLDLARDLRSDAITQPTEAMWQAMRDARPGWATAGEDPYVEALELQLALITGKEAAVFAPTGTVANLAALMTHGRRGEQVVVEQSSHILWSERDGLAHVCGMQSRALPGRPACPAPDDVDAAIRERLFGHVRRTALICLESTHNAAGGLAIPVDQIAELRSVADAHGIPIHLDGSRLLNASVALATSVQELVRDVDSVMVSLNKGLGAPGGAVLCGGTTFVAQARDNLARVGATSLHQAGLWAVAALAGLDTAEATLAEDHRVARRLSLGLASIEGLRVDSARVETNIVLVGVEAPLTAGALVAALRDRGIGAYERSEHSLRFVTHRHVRPEDVDAVVDAVGVAMADAMSDVAS